MGMDQVERILLSAFVALESSHFYSARLPSRMTIVSFVDSPKKVEAIRRGILEATAMTLGLGSIVSVLTKDVLPIIFAGGAAVLMKALYASDLKEAKENG